MNAQRGAGSGGAARTRQPPLRARDSIKMEENPIGTGACLLSVHTRQILRAVLGSASGLPDTPRGCGLRSVLHRRPARRACRELEWLAPSRQKTHRKLESTMQRDL